MEPEGYHPSCSSPRVFLQESAGGGARVYRKSTGGLVLGESARKEWCFP
jgi:hypothetical protein